MSVASPTSNRHRSRLQIERQFSGELSHYLALFHSSDLDSSRFPHPVCRGDKPMGQIDPDDFLRPARQFEGGPPNSAPQIQCTLDGSDHRQKIAHATDRVKQRFPWTKRVRQLIVRGPVMEQEILIDQEIAFVDISRRHFDER